MTLDYVLEYQLGLQKHKQRTPHGSYDAALMKYFEFKPRSATVYRVFADGTQKVLATIVRSIDSTDTVVTTIVERL